MLVFKKKKNVKTINDKNILKNLIFIKIHCFFSTENFFKKRVRKNIN